MINLNSLILEGKVSGEPSILEEEKGKVLRFTVKSERSYKEENGEEVKEISSFICEAFGTMADEKIVRLIQNERGIRIVGRLKQYTDCEIPYVCIVCEHIEFKLNK